MLATLVEEWGGEVSVTERVPDTSDALLRAVSRAIVAADLLLTSGRVSAGAFEVRESLGLSRTTFVSVAMQPGKPQVYGRPTRDTGEDMPVISPPGNS